MRAHDIALNTFEVIGKNVALCVSINSLRLHVALINVNAFYVTPWLTRFTYNVLIQRSIIQEQHKAFS